MKLHLRHRHRWIFVFYAFIIIIIIRQNKTISVFWVTGLEILGRVGIYVFFIFFLNLFMHFEGEMPFKMHKIIFFSRKHEKNRFHQ